MNQYETGLWLWQQWTAMWNGQPELARELVAPRFALHLPPPAAIDQTTVTDPETATRWVREHLAKFESLTFRYDAGPFVDVTAGVVAGPWSAEAVVGGVRTVLCGMDTIAYRDGLITEYWTVAKEAEAIDRWTARLAP